MQNFQDFLTEKQSGSVEIPTTKADSLKGKIEKSGAEVTKSDDEGLVVKYTDRTKLERVLMANGWDKEDIKALF